MAGEATQAQIGGFLVALRLKGETADEIAGFAEAIRGHGRRPSRRSATDLVDTAGTGGDGQATINISTAAALVAAAAGAGVAKHGNRAVSSASGSADVLEALGFSLDPPPERIADSIDELGFGFLFAPTHHPGFRHAAPVRTELATRTVFNVLGPLCNPAGARAQVVGVYEPALVRTIAEVLSRLGSQRAFVVHGAFGIDELSPAGPNFVCEVSEGEVIERLIDPLDFGIAPRAPEELRGGSPEQNAEVILAVFAGEERGAKRDAILLNAAGAIAAGEPRGGLARWARRSRARPSTPEPPRSGSRRWSRSRMGRFRDALGRARASRRSPSSSGGRHRWATFASARVSRELVARLRCDTARARVSVLVDERFAGSSTISRRESRNDRCRSSPKGSSRPRSTCASCARPVRTPRC